MEFFGYPDIENSYQEGFIEKIKEQGYGDIPYAVFEKIHGANSQIMYDIATGEFALGKRSGFLEENEPFYNLERAIKEYKERIPRIAKMLLEDLREFGQEVESIVVFGEICGGSYPHEEVVKDKTALRVQKGVFYAPENKWFAFDIAYKIKGVNRLLFLSANKFVNYCFISGLPMVPMVCVTDTLDKALEVSNHMPSKVYMMSALPEIKDNIMEGVVIRPCRRDIWMGYHRVILKNKNDLFKEKSRAKKDSVPKEIPENVKKACEAISQYITVNRVHNVISHIGEVTPKDVGKVIMLVSQDVLADFRKENDVLERMEKQEEKMVTKYMNGEVAKVVRDVVIFGKG